MLYSNCVIYLDGILIANETTIGWELRSNDQDVETVALGWAGISPSPDMLVINCSSVIPIAGSDFDFAAAKKNRTEVEIKLQQVGSGKSLVSKGYLMNVKGDYGVGKTSEESFEFHGKPSIFE